MLLHQTQGSVYSISVQLTIVSATSAVRFPCLFSVQWRTNDQRINLETGRYSPIGGKTDFNENLTMRTEIGWDRGKKSFIKKETQIQLNLVSKSRPDQVKLVGRVTIDLANILNEGGMQNPTQFPLQFCSVNASLCLSFRVLEKTETDISLTEIEKSIGDAYAINAQRIANLSGIKDKTRQANLRHELSPSSSILSYQQSFIKKEGLLLSTPPQKDKESSIIKEVSSVKDSLISIKDIKSNGTQQKSIEGRLLNLGFKNAGSPTNLISGNGAIFPSKQVQIVSESSKNSSTIKDDATSVTTSKLQVSQQFANTQTKATEHRLQEELNRQKLETDRLKLEVDKRKHEQQKYRYQIQRYRKEIEQQKADIKTKQGQIDLYVNEVASLKVEMSRTREETTKGMQQSVSITLKMAELRDANNKMALQLSNAEREIKRLQNANALLQQTQGAKNQLFERIRSLQYELQQYQRRTDELEKQKYDLESNYLRLDQENQERGYQYNSNIQSLQNEIKSIRLKFTDESTKKNEQSMKIDSLSKELQKLTHLSHEYQNAKQNWEITKGISDDELIRKTQRIRQLEEMLLSLNDKVRWLEGQNQLLTDNCRQNREQVVKMVEERRKQSDKIGYEIKRIEQQLNTYKSNYEQTLQILSKTKQEKSYLQIDLTSLSQSYNQLHTEFENLRNEHQIHLSHADKLTAIIDQNNTKCQELEELLITTNEQRNRQRQESKIQKEAFTLKIAQMQGEINRIRDFALIGEQKLVIMEEELRGRQGMIARLQEGLTNQIERSQALSKQLIHYLQQEEKLRRTIEMLENQAKEISNYLLEQENKEILNQQILQMKENKLIEVFSYLEKKTKYAITLELKLEELDRQAISKIAVLNQQAKLNNTKSQELSIELGQKEGIIRYLEQSNQEKQQISQSNLRKLQTDVERLLNHLTLLEQDKQGNQQLISDYQARLAQLQNHITSKESQITDLKYQIDQKSKEIEKIESQNKTNNSKIKQNIISLEHSNQQLALKCSQLENQASLREEIYKQDVIKYTEELKQAKNSYERLSNETATFDISSCRQEIKEKNKQIARLQGELKSAKIEASKISALQRSLKIKTIELNSVKNRSKSQPIDEKSQILLLKDQEITALIKERDQLLSKTHEIVNLQNRIVSLTEQLEILEEQKFNIESLYNEKVLFLEQAREDNRKLMEEITIIGERNGQLQRSIQQMQNSTNVKDNHQTGEKALKVENMMLRKQVKECEQLKLHITTLQQICNSLQKKLEISEQKVVTSSLAAKSKSNGSYVSETRIDDSKQFVNTFKCLRQLVDHRGKQTSQQQFLSLFELSKREASTSNVHMEEKAKLLSKQLQKLKVTILKSTQGKGGQEKLRIMNLFKICEGVVSQIAKLSEEMVY